MGVGGGWVDVNGEVFVKIKKELREGGSGRVGGGGSGWM